MSRLLPVILFGAWSTLCNVWLWILFLQFKARRQKLFLTAASTVDGASDRPPEPVRIIVPARNSGHSIGPCVRSILAQDYDRLRLTLVDDRSEDDTADILGQLAREDSRVDVLRVTALPAGWLGKSHALWTAAMTAEEEWLLFVDDDCILEPAATRQAVAYATAQQADLLTLWPRHLASSFWEHVVIPLCGGVIALWFGSPGVNRDESSVAFANGQFLLIRRDAYRRIDGHAAVRDAIIEDVPLAEAAKRAGLRCRVASGADLFGVRMYTDYRGVIDGWTRIFVGALRSGPKLLASMAWLLFGNLLPFVALPFGIAGRPAVLALSVAHITLMMLASYRFWGMGRCDRRYLWLYPLSVLVVLRILAAAWYRLALCRRISWRNTVYRIDRAGRILHT